MKKDLNMLQTLVAQGLRGGGITLNSNTKGFSRSLTLKNIFDFKKPEKKKTAFTLAETMIVIVVLGIIATLTIPALVNKNKESVAKTKVRKAMAAYESAINKMIIENDLKSDTALNEWAGATANCGNPSNYFKKVQDVNGCIFKTSDGIWWDISDIERPVISFKEINADNATQITTNANNANDKTAFVLVGRFGTDGSLRVDDLAYEKDNSISDDNNYESYEQVAKLYNFIGIKENKSDIPVVKTFSECNGADTCIIEYDCPALEDQTKTCNIEYKKMARNIYECVDERFDGNWSAYKCYKYVQTQTIEERYITIEGQPEWYNRENAKSEKNCAKSTYNGCSGYGDYWTLAKTHCESTGGRLPTAEELFSISSQLPEGTCYWASNTNYYNNAANYVCNPTPSSLDMSFMNDGGMGVICVDN